MASDALVQIRTLTKSKRDIDLTDEQEDDIEAWIKDKLSTGDKQISKQEAKDGILAFAKKYDIPPPTPEEWKELEKIFDEVDTSGNGKIDGKELETAWEAYEKEQEADGARLQVKVKNLVKRDVDLTEEQEAEIEAWVKEKLSTGDNEISWKEAKKGLKAFVKKHKMPKITKKEWKELKKAFKKADTNNNGKIDAAELEAAIKAHEEKAFLQVKNMMGAKRDIDLSKEQEDEIEAWVKEKLTTGDE